MKVLKKVLATSMIITLGLGLVACNKDDKKATDSSSEYKIGVLSIDDSFPIYVAKEEGLFEKEGVNVKVVPFKSSSEESQALESKSIDMMMNDMVVQSLLKKSNTDTKILATAYGAKPEEGRFVVLAAPNSNIKTAEEFYGKKVGISKNTMMQYLMDSYYDYLKLDINKVDLVNIPNLQTRMESLLSGKIDGAILPDPLASLAIKKGAIPVIDDTKLEENFSQSVIVVRDDVLKSRKEDTGKVMKCIYTAMEEINKDPNKYMEEERKFSRVPEPLKENYPMPHYSPNKVPTKDEVKRVQDWLVKNKLIDKQFDYDAIVGNLN